MTTKANCLCEMSKILLQNSTHLGVKANSRITLLCPIIRIHTHHVLGSTPQYLCCRPVRRIALAQVTHPLIKLLEKLIP